MNFSGWVAFRRGILEHTLSGHLSTHELAAMTVLILLADKETGAGRINSPLLRYYLPDLSDDAAKRVLKSLEEKGYIFREVVVHSKRAYRYWVNKYAPTTGLNAMRLTDISQALATKDVGDIRYSHPAPDGAPQTAPQGTPQTAPQGAPSNKKEKEKEKENKKTSSSSNGDLSVTQNVTADVSAKAQTCEQGGDFSVTRNVISCDDQVIVGGQTQPRTGAGLRWSGPDGGYVDQATGKLVDLSKARERIKGATGLEQFGATFINSTGAEVTWDEAQRLIAGEERRTA